VLGIEMRQRFLLRPTAHAVWKAIDKRRLVFDVKVCDKREEIGNGIPERCIIDKVKLMERTNSK
jgi:predicted thioesterase